MHYLTFMIPVWLLYMLLTGNWAINNIITGLVLAGLVALLVRPVKRPFTWHRLPDALLASGIYLLRLLWDLLLSGLQVARIVLTPSLPIKPGIVAIPSECESDLGVALSAHAITLTPGEMVVEIDDEGIMYTHMLDASNPDEHVEAAQRTRRDLLSRIFV
ncbi:Na+/H+ antiporter subunit E [Candidatus Leptofilum sp.]|uniref:Na+/H+ antiporter subunit E n=1 Tax=Candidatus Leptofilum sp. TaxID=3241576 RepID=UPI003B5B8E52